MSNGGPLRPEFINSMPLTREMTEAVRDLLAAHVEARRAYLNGYDERYRAAYASQAEALLAINRLALDLAAAAYPRMS